MWSFFSRDPSKEFSFDILDKASGSSDDNLWTLHKGKKKGSGEDVSVFTFDIKGSSDVQLEVARAAVKRLKTLRHPSILTYVDSTETDKTLYLATEHVEPLQVHLAVCGYDGQQKELYLSWGIFQIMRALSFLNNDGSMRHNNVCLSSVFVNNAGEWKLGAVEYLTNIQESSPGMPIKIMPELEKYDPPEKTDPNKQKLITKW